MRKMASKTFLAVMLLIVVFFISGCGSSNGGNVKKAAYEIIDDQGAMIQLEHKPERILTLAMGTDSIVLGILPEEKLIAINSLADDPVSSNIVDKANRITRKIKNPRNVIILIGLVLKDVIPSIAKESILPRGYLLSPANLSPLL